MLIMKLYHGCMGNSCPYANLGMMSMDVSSCFFFLGKLILLCMGSHGPCWLNSMRELSLVMMVYNNFEGCLWMLMIVSQVCIGESCPYAS